MTTPYSVFKPLDPQAPSAHDAVAPDDVIRVATNQATAVPFKDLFVARTFVCLVLAGEKQVVCPVAGGVNAIAGDVVVFPAGALVTMENRPARDMDYRAEGLFFAGDLVRSVFGHARPRGHQSDALSVLSGDTHAPGVFARLAQTLSDTTLPSAIRRHRLLEPLVWLHGKGVVLSVNEDGPLARLRAVLDGDIAHPWRASEVARTLAMSEPTFRRWLGREGLQFSVVLRNARLEHGLLLLQTSDASITRIALECGFRTPSHFAEAFRARFGHRPGAIRRRAD